MVMSRALGDVTSLYIRIYAWCVVLQILSQICACVTYTGSKRLSRQLCLGRNTTRWFTLTLVGKRDGIKTCGGVVRLHRHTSALDQRNIVLNRSLKNHTFLYVVVIIQFLLNTKQCLCLLYKLSHVTIFPSVAVYISTSHLSSFQQFGFSFS